jgi:hypothetical protein
MGNQIRTTILLALMTTLILWVGQLLAGRQGMIIAHIFAAGMNFFSYRYSDKLVLKMYRARRSAAFPPTARGGFLSLDPCLDDIRCTTNARGNSDGTGRTIPGTCSALHASVEIFDFGLFPLHLKNSVGANAFTHAAAHTSFGVELQCRYAV